jgi:hypothetical protein
MHSLFHAAMCALSSVLVCSLSFFLTLCVTSSECIASGGADRCCSPQRRRHSRPLHSSTKPTATHSLYLRTLQLHAFILHTT